VQLQQSLPDLQKRGLGLAAVSYDPPATLKTFADQRGITFPLLSDAGSATIKAFGILNAEATGRTAGIPYPGTFLLDRRGIVVSRSFEERYQERATASSLAARATGGRQAGSPTADTPHLSLTTTASDPTVAPGTRFSLYVDITPKPKMHLYAPEEKEAIPVELKLDADDAFKVHAPEFPRGEKFFFAPLKLTQLVYSKPFRITQDVTLALTPAFRERARAAGATLEIKGTLRYQACDDKVCYPPKDLPLAWIVSLKPLER
jgi:hypothetical protein